MSFGSVTARSTGGVSAANQNRAPQKYNVEKLRVSSPASRRRKAAARIKPKKTLRSRAKPGTPLPRRVRTRIPRAVSTKGIRHAIKQAQKRSLTRIALLVTRTVARSTPLSLVTLIAADYLYNKVVAPSGFPGFENIGEGWRDEQHHLGFEPGDYVPNLFDVGPFGPPPSRALLDSDDASIPLGIRYWGDFGVDPYDVPGTVGDNWPTEPIWLPNPVPAVAPRRAYEPQANLNPRARRQPERNRRAQARARHRNISMTFRIRIGRGRLAASASFTVKNDQPGGRILRDQKATPANQFLYAVLKTLANTLGETKEWTDILAEAAGYPGFSSGPFERGHHQTVQKAWWLFIDGGINEIDFDLLAVLVIENEIEDFVIGVAGQMSKFAARSLGLTVGPQTGLAL